MASAMDNCAEHVRGSKGLAEMEEEEEEEEEEELFEINLDVVNNFPPPHYWESFFTSTNNALLANCLLPIADVSNAVPMVSSKAFGALSLPGKPGVLFIAESMPGKLLGFQSLGGLLCNTDKM